LARAYHYVRFRWRGLDLEKVANELARSFKVERIENPDEDTDISPYLGERLKLKITADTLAASLSPIRAVLYQKEPAPFTERDLQLRKKIFDLYPRGSSTPLLPSFREEPEFEKST